MSKTESTLPEIPNGVSIEAEGGVTPVQIEGTIDGVPFYFRARGMFWRVSIGEKPVLKPAWFWGQRYSHERGAAGFMSLKEARTFLFDALARYRAGEPGNEKEHQEERSIESALEFEPGLAELEKKAEFKQFVDRQRGILAKARTEGRIPDAA